MDPVRSQKIISALSRKGATKPCPRCGSTHFSVVAETAIEIQPEMPKIVVAEAFVPAAVITCTNCGYLTQHALAALGLSPEVLQDA